MLSLNSGIGKTTGTGRICSVKELHPGHIFFLRSEGVHRLAVALQGDDRHAIWLNLTGDRAFTLEASDQYPGAAPRVFHLPYSPEDVLLRIGEQSTTANFGEHTLGQLLVSEENGVCISAAWPRLEGQGYRHVVAPGRWEQDRLADPRFAFDCWALSVVDHSGAWVDLVTRGIP